MLRTRPEATQSKASYLAVGLEHMLSTSRRSNRQPLNKVMHKLNRRRYCTLQLPFRPPLSSTRSMSGKEAV